jgi:SAM-dependent methyltransferase
MKRHGKAFGAGYYDRDWKRLFRARKAAGTSKSDREMELARAVASHVVGSVLDLGCGDGTLSKFVRRGSYLGVDFSPFVIGEAKRLNRGRGARFLVGDILDLPELDPFDTVVMMEVLEHLDNPAQVVELVRPLARKRIVVSVPVRSYSGSDSEAHVWPTWSEGDVKQILGTGATCQTFRRWRIGMWEKEEK